MTSTSEPQKVKDAVLSRLDVAIDALNLAKEIVPITPAKAAFGSVIILLTMVKVCFLAMQQTFVHVCQGHYRQQTRLCQSCTILRPGLRRP